MSGQRDTNGGLKMSNEMKYLTVAAFVALTMLGVVLAVILST